MRNTWQDFEILGWHDGITEALVRVEDEKWIYASMLAWNPQLHLRIFGLVEADPSVVAEVRELLALLSSDAESRAAAWSRLRSRIARFLLHASGQAEIRLCDELDGETKATLQVDVKSIIDLLGKEIDDAVDDVRFSLLAAKLNYK